MERSVRAVPHDRQTINNDGGLRCGGLSALPWLREYDRSHAPGAGSPQIWRTTSGAI